VYSVARLINEQNVIKNNISNFLQQSSQDYSKYMEGTPTFVTFYNKNRLASTQDISLESVVEVVGSESPIQYNKIENFALYGMDSVSITQQLDEFGITSEFDGSATILPNTIKPLPDDYFTVDYNGTEHLFRITSVDPDKVKGGVFYKMSYTLSNDSTDLIEEQVEGSYELLYENLGTEDKVIIKKSSADLIRIIDGLEENLQKFYIKNYMSKFSVIAHKMNNKNIYNDFLVKFIKDTSLFSRKRNYLSSVYIIDVFGVDSGWFNEEYEGTLFHAIQFQTAEDLKYENFSVTRILDETTPFYGSYEMYFKSNYGFVSSIPGTQFVAHDNTLVSNIKSNTLYADTKAYALENIVISFLNKTILLDEQFLIDLNKINFKPTLQEFLLVPCIISILKTFKSSLM